MRTTSLYHRASPESWKGRVDSLEDRDAFRLHQVVECLDLEQEPPKVLPPGFVGFGLLGYCGDQGVQQNLGRPGAAQGPMSIRQELANLPCTFDANTHLYDAGDVVVDEEPMERGQHALGLMVSRMLGAHLFPILLGGGHELALGHYRGIREWLGQPGRRSPPKLGIINFDAHLDLRPHDQGASSGTMFSQIAELCERAGDGFSYCCVGAQMYGNTTSLFRKARSLNSLTLLAREINETGTQEALKTVLNFAGQHDYL
ncbi:MAG: formimidoylglutamase, partial [Planctomycetota bacterium]